LMEHSTLAMTRRYLQSLDVDDAMKAHKRFSPLDNSSKVCINMPTKSGCENRGTLYHLGYPPSIGRIVCSSA